MVTMDGRRAPVVMDNVRSTSLDRVRLPDAKASHNGSSSASDRTPLPRSTSSSKNGALLRGWLYEDTNVVPGLVIRRCVKLRACVTLVQVHASLIRYGALLPHAVATFTKENDKNARNVLVLTGTEVSPLIARVCTIKKRRTPIITALTSNNFKTRKLVRRYLKMLLRIVTPIYTNNAPQTLPQTGFRLTWTPQGGSVQEASLYFDEPHTAEAWRELMLLSTDARPLRTVPPLPPTAQEAVDGVSVFQGAPGPSLAESPPHSMAAASAEGCACM